MFEILTSKSCAPQCRRHVYINMGTLDSKQEENKDHERGEEEDAGFNPFKMYLL